MSDKHYKVVDGVRSEMSDEEVASLQSDFTPTPEYIANRIGAPEATNKDNVYPNLSLQLDMLWHDIDNGLFGDQAKTGSFYKTIHNIKNSNPKGN